MPEPIASRGTSPFDLRGKITLVTGGNCGVGLGMALGLARAGPAWGCPTPAMWAYRLGAMRAKRLMLTGDLIDGQQAYEWGLATDVAPIDQLDACVHKLAERIAGVPTNQLMMLKPVINQAIDAMGLEHTQMFATVFDGITRHSPEGLWFKRYAEEFDFPAAWNGATAAARCPSPGQAIAAMDSWCRRRPEEVSVSASAKRTAPQGPAHRGRCAGQQPTPMTDAFRQRSQRESIAAGSKARFQSVGCIRACSTSSHSMPAPNRRVGGER